MEQILTNRTLKVINKEPEGIKDLFVLIKSISLDIKSLINLNKYLFFVFVGKGRKKEYISFKR